MADGMLAWVIAEFWRVLLIRPSRYFLYWAMGAAKYRLFVYRDMGTAEYWLVLYRVMGIWESPAGGGMTLETASGPRDELGLGRPDGERVRGGDAELGA